MKTINKIIIILALIMLIASATIADIADLTPIEKDKIEIKDITLSKENQYCFEYAIKEVNHSIKVGNITLKNGSIEYVMKQYTEKLPYCINEKEVIKFRDKVVETKPMYIGVVQEEKEVIVIDKLDGGLDNKLDKGDTYCSIKAEGINCYGDNAEQLKRTLSDGGLK